MASVKDGSRHYLSGALGKEDAELRARFLEFAKAESGTPDMVVNCFPGLGEPLDAIRARNPGREYFDTQWTGAGRKISPATATSPQKKKPGASGGSLTVVSASGSNDGKLKATAKTTSDANPAANAKPAPGKSFRGFLGKNCEHARKVANSKGTFVETAKEVSPKGSCIVQGWYTPNPNAAPRQ